MGFLDYFRKSSPRTAGLAKERLSIIVAREHQSAGERLDYLPQLKQELLQVIAKYEKIDLEKVSVNLEHNGDCEVLELNVVLAENEPRRAMPSIGASPSRW
jgi:cell division topological specificity factor